MGIHAYISPPVASNTKLLELAAFQEQAGDWLFGHLAYDLKNEIETLSSENPDAIGFPDLYFFIPETVILLEQDKITLGSIKRSPSVVWKEINAVADTIPAAPHEVAFQNSLTETTYLETVNKLKTHIARGDCYEINFCQEFFANGVLLNPLEVYRRLSNVSPNPFSAFYKIEEKYLLCASPERFLKKTGNKICCQPIKGTARRIASSREEDNAIKAKLFASKKERAENIMIVDLVRNDLSKVCREGSVQVDEFLFVYSFPQVHQMISTISGILGDNVGIDEIIRATFPMGSMTGAPKKRVMELIENYESAKRGLFSGTIGYFNPAGDFDFNVVIRSIQYNLLRQYVSIMVGSAITSASDPQEEYDECLLKLEPMLKALQAVKT